MLWAEVYARFVLLPPRKHLSKNNDTNQTEHSVVHHHCTKKNACQSVRNNEQNEPREHNEVWCQRMNRRLPRRSRKSLMLLKVRKKSFFLLQNEKKSQKNAKTLDTYYISLCMYMSRITELYRLHCCVTMDILAEDE